MSYIDVSEATFEQDVLVRSHEVPVVVDFWAAWCGPCRALGPVLEKLAAEANGSWTLAKLDVDANQELAAAFGIQGIPAVKAFKDGREVAEFVGALPEPQVRSWLARLGPSEADRLVDAGLEAESRGQVDEAVALYRRALSSDPAHARAQAALSKAELSLRAASRNEDELRARVESDPADVDAAKGLADVLAGRGEHERAFEVLLDAIRVLQDGRRDDARLHMLSLLNTLASDDPRAMAARRALSLALY